MASKNTVHVPAVVVQISDVNNFAQRPEILIAIEVSALLPRAAIVTHRRYHRNTQYVREAG